MKKTVYAFVFSLFVIPLVGCVPEAVTEEEKPADINVIKTHFNGNNAFVYTRDINNTTGAAAIIDLDTLKVIETGIGEGSWFSSDVMFQSDSRYVYIIDRTNANITIIDPLDATKELKQISVGAGTNPKSVVRLDNKLYISRYDSADMLVLDAETFEQVGLVDLSAFSSPGDGKPEMGFAVTAENQVWVVLERIDQDNYFSPTTLPFDGSYLVSIDPKTNAVDKQVKLLGVSPYQLLKIDALTGSIYTVSQIDYASGIELVDPISATSKGWLVEPASFPEGIFFAEASTTYTFIISGEGFQGFDLYDWNASVLWAIDRKTDEQIEVTRTDAGYMGLSCLELSPEKLLVACAGPGVRVTKPGVRVFDSVTLKELTTKPLDTDLPPFGITFFNRPVTEVVSQPATSVTE